MLRKKYNGKRTASCKTAAAMIMLLSSVAAMAAPLTVQVSGLQNANGLVAIAVFASADGFPFEDGRAVWRGMVPIDAGVSSVTVTVPELPDGDYAVSTFHDDNKSGVLETNMFGIPKKGYGFSNNPKTTLRPARFDEASFTLPAQGATVGIALKY